MPYDTFRNEDIYAAPDIDTGLLSQAAHNLHARGMQRREHEHEDGARKRKDDRDRLAGLSEGATEHTEIQKGISGRFGSLLENFKNNGYNFNPEDKANAEKLAQDITWAKKNDEKAKGVQAQIAQQSSDDIGFNSNKALDKLQKIKGSARTNEEASSAYDQFNADPLEFHEPSRILNKYLEESRKKMPKNSESISIESPGGVTRTTDIEQSTPFMKDLGMSEQKMPDGTTRKIQKLAPITSTDDMISEGYVDDYFKFHPLQKAAYVKSVTDEEVDAAIKLANEKRLKDGDRPNLSKENMGDAIRDEIAQQKAAKDLLDANKGINDVRTALKREKQPAPAAGSMDKFTIQTASSSPQQNLVRERSSKMSDGTTKRVVGTYSYHTPMKSVAILDDKGNPLKVSVSNVSGTNETTGREFATAQTVEGAPLNGLNFAIGNRVFKNGKLITRESNVSADKSKDWYAGVDKVLSVENLKKEILKDKDPVIYPWAEVSVPKRRNDFTDLSPKDRQSAERLQELSKIPPGDLTPEQREEYANLHVKYNEYIDHNVSTDASNIPQLNQYAKKKGFSSVSKMLEAQMSPEERQKFRKTVETLERNKAIAKKEIAEGNTAPVGYNKSDPSSVMSHIVYKLGITDKAKAKEKYLELTK